MENQQLTSINNLPKTKEDIQLFADRLITGLDEGNLNAMEVLQALKAVEKSYDTIKPLLMKNVLNEMSKYPGKQVDFHGVTFLERESGVSYDYSGCGDPVYNRLVEELNDIKEKMKKRETLLRSIDGSMELLDEQTGEVNIAYPPVKKSTTSVQVNFK